MPSTLLSPAQFSGSMYAHVPESLVADTQITPVHPFDSFKRCLLPERIEEIQGPEGEEQHSWWQVVCLTGADYFSTLGYIPAIAALAAGLLDE